MGYFLKNREIPSGSTSTRLPHGSTADRPDSPVFGTFRYNTSIGGLEYFDGTIYKTVSTAGEANIVVDNFTGDNSTLTFTLSTAASNVDQIIVFISNIYQQPSTYSITGGGNDITLSAAPELNEPINVIHGLGNTP
tara:strand:+ start:211 stop:618 length:408 start_codon:yes stop_codon:yes gene_type:complete